MEFFATAAKGTEGVLRDELRELRFHRVRADRGGVHFEGDMADGWRACLESRIASRILLALGTFDVRDETALYAARSLDLAWALTPAQTLSVAATCRSSALTHSHFIALKTKDAIVDRIRDETGARPSVNTRSPDVAVRVNLARDRAQFHLDLSGEPLHRRGYRRALVEAPLKETLAAAILRFAGWDRTTAFIDPMCGTGTFAIEAALQSRDIAPGLARRFGFERWADHDASARARWTAMRERARERIAKLGPAIVASDSDPRAVSAARENALAAGVKLEITRRDISELRAPAASGLLATNPPYGERLAADEDLYANMARAFERLHGFRIAILSGTPAILRAMPPGFREHTLFNGAIECRLAFWNVE